MYCKITLKLLELFTSQKIYGRLISKDPSDLKDNLLSESNPESVFFNNKLYLHIGHILISLGDTLHLDTNNSIDLMNFTNNIIIYDYNTGGLSKNNELNVSKSLVIEAYGTIINYLNKNNLIDKYDNFQTYTKSLCLYLVKAYGELYKVYGISNTAIPVETTLNTLDERTFIKYIVIIIDFFIHTVQYPYTAGIFTENTIEYIIYIIYILGYLDIS